MLITSFILLKNRLDVKEFGVPQIRRKNDWRLQLSSVFQNSTCKILFLCFLCGLMDYLRSCLSFFGEWWYIRQDWIHP